MVSHKSIPQGVRLWGIWLISAMMSLTLIWSISHADGFHEPPHTAYLPWSFWPEDWPSTTNAQIPPRHSIFDYTRIEGALPLFGYPMRPATFAGLNDTVQIVIGLANDTGQPYPLTGEKVEQWFVPRVFANGANVHTSTPVLDSSQLNYRIRGWLYLGAPIPEPDTVFSASVSPEMVMDVWGLPPMFGQLVVFPTTDLPEDFFGVVSGDRFEVRQPKEQADTINAYEACFRRTMDDGNYDGAKDWVSAILDLNPHSVPGWWLQARLDAAKGDSSLAKTDYDHALDYLNNQGDPLLPDSTQKTLFPTERAYLEYLHAFLNYERSFYGD